MGLGAAVPLGFANSYALAMRDRDAAQLGVRTMGDLAAHPALRLGLSHEFLGRADGWPGLARHYGLRNQPESLDHGLAYDAIAAAQIDVMDIYTTDARIGDMNLRVLQDDRQYFPRYDALLLYRLDLPARFPAAWQALRGLEGRIDQQRMIALNAAVELEGRSFAQAAQEFLQGTPVASTSRAGLIAKLLDRWASSPGSTCCWSLCRSARRRWPASRSACLPLLCRGCGRPCLVCAACCRPSRRWRCWRS